MEMFVKAMRISGEIIQKDLLGRPLIPNWSRVFYAVPDFATTLVEAIDQDNERKFLLIGPTAAGTRRIIRRTLP